MNNKISEILFLKEELLKNIVGGDIVAGNGRSSTAPIIVPHE